MSSYGPHLLSNGPYLLDIMAQFGPLGLCHDSGLCRIRGYVVRHNVAFGLMTFSYMSFGVLSFGQMSFGVISFGLLSVYQICTYINVN